MDQSNPKVLNRLFRLVIPLSAGIVLAVLLLVLAHGASQKALAAPIEPPEGYPKFTQSRMEVSPTLAYTGGAVLEYTIEIINTGAYTGENTLFSNLIPANTTYNDDASSSVLPDPIFDTGSGTLTWAGDVGFDDKTVIRYSVTVDPLYEGAISNTAIIDHDLISDPVTVTVDAMITDNPVLEISKLADPEVPGPNKPLVYTLTVENIGQPSAGLPIVVTDEVPTNTTLLDVGVDGVAGSGMVTWTRSVTLQHGETTAFTFSVTVDDVPSGTVVSNVNYQVSNPESGIAVGELYTATVIDPILLISKVTDPAPPGANREMTYTLVVLNKGSLATDLLVTDVVPANVDYVRGGTLVGNTVEWTLPELGPDEAAFFTFTVYIGDEAAFDILNDTYEVCSAENVCAVGEPLSSTVWGPVFEVEAWLDPIAKAPGGGNTPVTPTIVVENLGPGNALAANAVLYFYRISVTDSDLVVIPPTGAFSPGPDCGTHCVAYRWEGDFAAGEVLTFTTLVPQSSKGGEEGTVFSATLVITDQLGTYVTDPVSDTAEGLITHLANLIPSKMAPPVVGAGQEMTYTITVFNSGQTTDSPPFPWVTDTVPASVTLVQVNDGGTFFEIGEQTVVSWSLPDMGPGEMYQYSYVVEVLPDLVSGTLIVNDDYKASWWDTVLTGTITGTMILSNTGEPITTVVQEVGLIDSYKEVTPTLLRPGEGHVLTYVVHLVNSSPVDFFDVEMYDFLPWQSTTYFRDAVASAGAVVSDIVSISWIGDVAAFSEERITFTVEVDPFFEGAITNTATITHSSLSDDVVREAVTYVTDDPVLQITKVATPSPVSQGGELQYTIRVTNLGQQASELVVTDLLPANTTYVEGSASGGGQLVGGEIVWNLPVLLATEHVYLTFRVTVLEGEEVVNAVYGVTCAEGVTAEGEPVITPVVTSATRIYLPVIQR